MHYGQIIGIGIQLRSCWWEVIDINVKKKWSQNRTLRDAISESSQTAFPSTTVGKGKIAIIDELHHHLDHVPIGQESKELAGKTPMPYSVVCCCEVNKHSTGFLFYLQSNSQYLDSCEWPVLELIDLVENPLVQVVSEDQLLARHGNE